MRFLLQHLTILLALSLVLQVITVSAQQSPYDFSIKTKEKAVLKTLVFYAGVQMHNFSIDRGIITDVEKVNPDNLWRIDRNAINQFSESAEHWSDYTMYGSMAMPILLNITSKQTKKDKWNIAMMGLHGFMIENGINSLTKNIFQRPRPFLFNNEWIIQNRSINKNSTRSFYSGHTSSSAYMCFFAAKTFADLHPENKWKTVVWGVAITLPAVTGYLRYKGRQHFPTDVITGYIIGGGIGYLIPSLYKSKRTDLTMGMTGLNFTYKI